MCHTGSHSTRRLCKHEVHRRHKRSGARLPTIRSGVRYVTFTALENLQNSPSPHATSSMDVCRRLNLPATLEKTPLISQHGLCIAPVPGTHHKLFTMTGVSHVKSIISQRKTERLSTSRSVLGRVSETCLHHCESINPYR
jgi:hypothetical protein